jgi:outer membrane receptor protein involved in Fe transport
VKKWALARSSVEVADVRSNRRELDARVVIVAATAWLSSVAMAAENNVPPSQPDTVETIIVSVTPLMGAGVPLNHVPSNVQTLRAAQIASDHSQTLTDAVDRHFASMTLADTEGNPFQKDLVSRGFTASPVLGTPQGLAIYQNGVRINEAFGDTTLWDFVPIFAISELEELPGSNPVFGPNALGGVLTLEMKDGFDFKGTTLEGAAGSFGRYLATAQSGVDLGDSALYIGAMALHDGGWRELSASDVVQTFADYALRGDGYSFGLSLTAAWNRLNGNGANPAQDDPRAAFAVPDLELDHLVFLQLRGSIDLNHVLSLHGTIYARQVDIEVQNGAASGFAPCGQTVCDDSGPVTLLNGDPIAPSVPYQGIVPTQTTKTLGVGGSLQLTVDAPLRGLPNVGNIGVSFDQGNTHFTSVTYLGSLVYLQPPGTVSYSDGQLVGGTAYNVRLDAVNRYYGVFLTDTLSLNSKMTVTLTGRFNAAQLDLSDMFTGALTGDHSYDRFNPSAGLTYQLSPDLNVYTSYSEANRIPTAAELSCANPAAPCTFPLGFVSDPDLKQVVARSFEVGARGRLSGADGLNLEWSADVFDTRNSNDIIFVSAGPLIGSGYFQNSGATQRLGSEVALEGTWGWFDFHANYGFVRATFESHLSILSEYNPGADANGNIYVQPGDRLPEVPLRTARVGAGVALRHALHLELDARIVSSQYLRGDEANLQAPLPGYTVVNALASWQATRQLSIYLRADNLFDHHYASFGLYGDPTGNGAFPQFTNPRFYVPGQPFGFWLGAAVRL